MAYRVDVVFSNGHKITKSFPSYMNMHDIVHVVGQLIVGLVWYNNYSIEDVALEDVVIIEEDSGSVVYSLEGVLQKLKDIMATGGINDSEKYLQVCNRKS